MDGVGLPCLLSCWEVDLHVPRSLKRKDSLSVCSELPGCWAKLHTRLLDAWNFIWEQEEQTYYGEKELHNKVIITVIKMGTGRQT